MKTITGTLSSLLPLWLVVVVAGSNSEVAPAAVATNTRTAEIVSCSG